ncbi:hypothetical protein B4N89_00100 [Embleya scabrispora]|uniref:ATP-grasp domain-containing protein n=1 Tax=Embleya scabrispora TaxID=159449 RepID=A0A1T3NHZ4_9ACTN|nr:hypothetical protein [Embleya scabrispora]OPC76437.1 hypothetical protein B4N89_47145 [Embleya scabrispora]OPC79560.1 hypothetical protein B4N89_00100 [Embleya scabrispora]
MRLREARVIVVAAESDFTADLVVSRLDRDAFVRMDPGRLHESLTVGGRFAAGAWTTVVDDVWRTARIGPGCAVYWRKPTHPDTHPDPDDRWRAEENTIALLGLLRAQPVLWVNDPVVVDAAEHKPAQLASAASHGMRVPDTLFTSDPARARAFVTDHHDKVVVKALTQRHTTFVPTTRLRASDDLDAIAGTLHYLQALVENRLFDARVTVVGDRVFAASITTPGALDWRTVLAADCRHAPITPPADVERACREHVRDLGLRYAALDFVVTADGWTYLETNCAGEFGWIEALAGLPISTEIARLLTHHTRTTATRHRVVPIRARM